MRPDIRSDIILSRIADANAVAHLRSLVRLFIVTCAVVVCCCSSLALPSPRSYGVRLVETSNTALLLDDGWNEQPKQELEPVEQSAPTVRGQVTRHYELVSHWATIISLRLPSNHSLHRSLHQRRRIPTARCLRSRLLV